MTIEAHRVMSKLNSRRVPAHRVWRTVKGALAIAVLPLVIGAGCVSDGVTPGGGGATGAGGGGQGGAAGTGAGAAGGVAGPGGAPVIITPAPQALPAASACVDGRPGPTFLRRLSVAELDATVRDLFKDQAMAVPSVFDDAEVLGFHVDSNALLIQGVGAQRLRDSAEELGHWAVTSRLAQIAPCATMDAACRRQVITGFGKRAFRAPLADERVAAYDALFAAETTFADGVEAMVTAMLQSPNFLYRTELGPSAGAAAAVALTPYEIASALSYLLVGSMPDDALLAAADSGALATPAGLEQQTERLLADPRAADALMRFASGWLQLGRLQTTVKDDTVFAVTPALRADMLGETRAVIVDAFNGNGGIPALLTGGFSFLNRNLAQFYGIDSSTLGDTFTKVTYGASIRRDPGILAHATILTGHATESNSSPSQRGKLVRTRLLCLNVPPMPNNLDTKLKEPTQPTTTRERYQQHAASTQCASCHHLMDPVGFGFEHYDGFGRYRDQENGFPIDATGTLTSVKEGDVPFADLRALSAYLAASEDAKTCLVRYWSYYAYGSVSWAQDGCTYDAIRQQATQSGFSLRGVLKAILQAPHFSRRVATP